MTFKLWSLSSEVTIPIMRWQDGMSVAKSCVVLCSGLRCVAQEVEVERVVIRRPFFIFGVVMSCEFCSVRRVRQFSNERER
jgi:hypothetical protein